MEDSASKSILKLRLTAEELHALKILAVMKKVRPGQLAANLVNDQVKALLAAELKNLTKRTGQQ